MHGTGSPRYQSDVCAYGEATRAVRLGEAGTRTLSAAEGARVFISNGTQPELNVAQIITAIKARITTSIIKDSGLGDAFHFLIADSAGNNGNGTRSFGSMDVIVLRGFTGRN